MILAPDFTLAMLTGQDNGHLILTDKGYHLHPQTLNAFLALQTKAKQAGFNLQPASCFRDFERQKMLWNSKFYAERPVLDRHSQPIDMTTLTVEQRCLAILHWSALPGTSRHHWGSDLDIYDPDQLPTGEKLKLEPWEYQAGGYFADLTHWLSNNMQEFGFYRPFDNPKNAIAVEPWHLSYRPLADQLADRLTIAGLLDVWHGHEIGGYAWLSANLATIFANYIHLNNKAGGLWRG